MRLSVMPDPAEEAPILILARQDCWRFTLHRGLHLSDRMDALLSAEVKRICEQ